MDLRLGEGYRVRASPCDIDERVVLALCVDTQDLLLMIKAHDPRVAQEGGPVELVDDP